MAAPARGYQIGSFRLETPKRRLLAPDGSAIALPGRAYDILAHLVEHRDRVVGKDELIKVAWPQTIVEDNNLNQAIAALRRALGDSRDAPRFIVTVPGRGYQFIGDVDALADAPVPAVDPAAVAGATTERTDAGTKQLPIAQESNDVRRTEAEAPGRRRLVVGGLAIAAAAATGFAYWWGSARPANKLPQSIAVLPFRPLLPEERNPALELGVTELLINRLSRLPGIVVLPLSSVMRYATPGTDALEAGRKLDVDAVVEGHVHVQQERVRLTARLVAVGGGESLWANAYTERLGELLAVQESLAMQIADALTTQLSGATRANVVASETTSVEAWQLYSNGRYQVELRDANGLRRAIDFFAAALERDPRFASASAALSDAHTLTAVFSIEPPAKAFRAARAAALRALELSPDLAQAHMAMGHVATNFEFDLEAGRRHYLRAIEIDPRYARALAQLALNRTQAGDLAAARDAIRHAQSLEPTSLPFLGISGFIRHFERAFDDAEKELARIVATAPQAWFPRQFLAHTMLARGKGTEVLRLLDGRNEPGPTSLSNLGRALAQAGRAQEARQELARLDRLGRDGFGVGFAQALIHVDLGERDPALAALERGVTDLSQMQMYLNVEPALDGLRADPRFQALRRKLRLA